MNTNTMTGDEFDQNVAAAMSALYEDYMEAFTFFDGVNNVSDEDMVKATANSENTNADAMLDLKRLMNLNDTVCEERGYISNLAIRAAHTAFKMNIAGSDVKDHMASFKEGFDEVVKLGKLNDLAKNRAGYYIGMATRNTDQLYSAFLLEQTGQVDNSPTTMSEFDEDEYEDEYEEDIWRGPVRLGH